MTTIYKYPLDLTEEQQVPMPSGAEVLTVQDQGGSLVLWAKVDPSARLIGRRIFCHGTGHTMQPKPSGFEMRYIATVQQRSGLVWHFFEENGE